MRAQENEFQIHKMGQNQILKWIFLAGVITEKYM